LQPTLSNVRLGTVPLLYLQKTRGSWRGDSLRVCSQAETAIEGGANTRAHTTPQFGWPRHFAFSDEQIQPMDNAVIVGCWKTHYRYLSPQTFKRAGYLASVQACYV